MNQTQRKYAVQRIDNITRAKYDEITKAFVSNPINKKMVVPPVNYYSTAEIIKALMGEKSTAKLIDRKEILRQLKNSPSNVRIHTFAHPANESQITPAVEQNKAIHQRYEKEVTLKHLALTDAAQKAIDLIMLGDNEEVLYAINSFEELTV